MTNEEVASTFFRCYQQHDFRGMQRCLDKEVIFSDFGFHIQGEQVHAMWHWFCIPYAPRKEPINVQHFEIINCSGDTAKVRYRVDYKYGEKHRPVNYIIEALLTIRDGRIQEHHDKSTISDFAFANMTEGFPLSVLALTPLYRRVVQKKAPEKLASFMESKEYKSSKS